MEQLNKKIQKQGAQVLKNKAYLKVRRNEKGFSIPAQMDFLFCRQKLKTLASAARSIKCGPPSRTILEKNLASST